MRLNTHTYIKKMLYFSIVVLFEKNLNFLKKRKERKQTIGSIDTVRNSYTNNLPTNGLLVLSNVHCAYFLAKYFPLQYDGMLNILTYSSVAYFVAFRSNLSFFIIYCCTLLKSYLHSFHPWLTIKLCVCFFLFCLTIGSWFQNLLVRFWLFH